MAAVTQVVDGSLDPTFDQDGIRVDDFGSTDAARGVAVQPDGKIVIAGTSCGGDILVARYDSTGALDPSFGSGGRVCVDVAGGSTDQGEEIFVLGDGKLLVAGTSAGDFALVRLNPDGSPDLTFDGDGKATYDFGANEQLYDAALAPGGKVVLVGSRERPGCQNFTFLPTVDAAIARVNPDGGLDPSFGEGGRVLVENAAVVRAQAVAVQPDGAVLVGGRMGSCSRVAIDYWLVRLTPAGAPDATFSASRDFFELGGDSVADIALQPDGKLVVVIDTFVGPATTPARDDAFTVLRISPDGSLDATFDGDGVATVLFGPGTNATPNAVVVQGDGKVLVGGSLASTSGGAADFALARFNPDGSLDTTFASDATVVTDLGSDDLLLALALQADARVVASGTSGGNVALARYLLGGNGTATTVPPTTTSTSTTSTLATTSTTSTSTTLPTSTTTTSTSTTTTTPARDDACDGRTPTIMGTAGNDRIFGTSGPDVILGGGGNDWIAGLGGDDAICGNDGADTISGGGGNDTLIGGAGNDALNGDSGNDVLNGGEGNDRLSGGPGNDALNGAAGRDQCVGGAGVDTGVACEGTLQVP
jgi:uncharacterized delta-60 repeat protein